METTTGQEPQNKQAMLLNLDAPERVVSWRNHEGVARRHIFRRIVARDWDGYFSRIAVESEGEERVVDVTSAALWLYSQCAIRAEGYRVKGGALLESLPNWQMRIPQGHRIQAIDKILEVSPSAESNAEIEPEIESVSLDALWNESPGEGDKKTAPGTMNKFSGLMHRFAPPLAEHEMKFSRETSRARVVGGSRTGRTIYPARQKVLIALYDELIVSVDGYAVGGIPLEKRENIVREMDSIHKYRAALQLFSWAGEETQSEEEGAEPERGRPGPR